MVYELYETEYFSKIYEQLDNSEKLCVDSMKYNIKIILQVKF